jgi:hypothetical protein
MDGALDIIVSDVATAVSVGVAEFSLVAVLLEHAAKIRTAGTSNKYLLFIGCSF